MNPFATSRSSFWGIPKSLTWSPARTDSRVHELSLLTSTCTVSPEPVSTTNSRDETAVTLPWTRQRSSPPEASGATAATCGARGAVGGTLAGGTVGGGTALGTAPGGGVAVWRGNDDGTGVSWAGGGTVGATKFSAESPAPTTTAAISWG